MSERSVARPCAGGPKCSNYTGELVKNVSPVKSSWEKERGRMMQTKGNLHCDGNVFTNTMETVRGSPFLGKRLHHASGVGRADELPLGCPCPMSVPGLGFWLCLDTFFLPLQLLCGNRFLSA